jgi:valyl-tRNA synthetase
MNLPKQYEPAAYESDIYALWESSRAFSPEADDHKESYSIVIPPPNANGNLHIGHALTLGLEDIAVRYQRMKGKHALLLPGADHAGFETQVVYEKKLSKEGKSRFDFSREELYAQIWDFVAENRGNFEQQLRKLGASVDWSRFTFTLDERITNRSYLTFKQLWEEGLVYRGERLVNYCTHHRTGFADVEVTYEEAITPLYYLKYGPFELATTRPETKFGDTAVAVHPDDDRYKAYVGKVVTVEGVNGPFEVRVIADEMVDRDFGTGVVKITPAHSFDDWEVAQRHNLPAVRVINHDGTMNHHAGRFEGMTVMEARTAVAKALKEMGLLVKVDTQYKNRVGKCYKCGTVIEPMLMEQWFINMESLAKPAIAALKAGKITFYPESKKIQLITYLENLRDWNISRQIAWGIPIPAFQNVNDTDDWVYDERVTEEIIEIDGKTYRRDPDVFDTWFSSSSWPYATLNYPDNPDFKQFYPLSLMETGGEILYPWVSRMIMLGLYVTGEVPFTSVYVHGYVLAEDGSKMSKSIGNVINPSDVIETYGSDALRMGIVAGRAPAVNRGYDPRKVEDARNFCNKLWNIARYIENKLGDAFTYGEEIKPQTNADHWMLHKLQQGIRDIDNALQNYSFAEAYEKLYHLVWDDVADWYIEASKTEVNQQLLAHTLETILKLTHPFAPFVTETIWQTLNWQPNSLLATSDWPTTEKFDVKLANEFEEIITIVSECRAIITTLQLYRPKLYFTNAPFLAKNTPMVMRLARLYSIDEVSDGKGLHLTQTTHNCWIDVDYHTAKSYVTKLSGQMKEREAAVDRLNERLTNEGYIKRAPKKIVDETRTQLADEVVLLNKIKAELDLFLKATNSLMP